MILWDSLWGTFPTYTVRQARWKQARLFFVTAALLLATPAFLKSTLLLAGWRQPPAEPRYKGLPLTKWIEQLQDKDALVRQEALEALATLGSKAAPAAPAVVKALDDPIPAVRMAALNALGKLGPAAKEAVPVLTRGMKDRNMEYRLAAIRVLGTIGTAARDAVPAMAEALKRSGCSTPLDSDPQPG